MNKGLGNTSRNFTQNSPVMVQNKKLPLNIANFINEKLTYVGKPAVVEAFQIKKLISNQFLKDTLESDLVRLLPFLEPVSLSFGESIYQMDDIIDYVYFPESAVFSQTSISEDGRMNEISMTGQEGVVGFLAVFNSCPQGFWTQISVAGSALKISSDVLKREFAGSNSIQNSFLNYINSYISQISQRVICNNHHRIEERFYTWLLMLHDRCSTNKLQLTHEQIADCLGVNRPSITQITQTLREKEIINYKRGEITISDRKKLEVMACSCYKNVAVNCVNYVGC